VGWARWAACILPCGLLLLAASAGSPAAERFFLYRLEGLRPVYGLPLAALVFTLAALWLLLRPCRRRTPQFFTATTAMSFLPLLMSLNVEATGYPSSSDPYVAAALCYSACSLLLFSAVYRTNWENAYIDELTGVPNRRALSERLYRLGRHYTVSMIDIDYFKAFNDTYGHAEGDNVLRYVASNLERSFGARIFRYGGEEFCVLLQDMPVRNAARLVEGARQFITAKDFFIRASPAVREHTSSKDRGHVIVTGARVHISFSAGVAYRDLPEERPEDVIDMADKALYEAKRAGRGRVFCYGQQAHAPEPGVLHGSG
jgi:diguanylate cyclase (GGDEF)-like protein